MFLRIALLAAAFLASSSTYAKDLSGELKGQTMHPLSLQEVHSSANMKLTQKYLLGDPAAVKKTYVEVFQQSTQASGDSLAKRASPPNSTLPKSPPPKSTPPKSTLNGGRTIDLTPSECTSQVCYSGSFRGPLKTDCDDIVAAQLYNSTGSLTAFPGTYVLVYSGTCVVVFQHPMGKPENNYTFDYNWASLGKIMVGLQKKCLSNPEAQSIGGACKIDSYLKYTFENVLISLQRYVQPDPPSHT